jgi:hypothetical protein
MRRLKIWLGGDFSAVFGSAQGWQGYTNTFKSRTAFVIRRSRLLKIDSSGPSRTRLEHINRRYHILRL